MPEVRNPLFDRLVDLEPRNRAAEVRPRRTLDREQLLLSVQRELLRLLNTRSSHPADQLADRELTVLDYGLPDISHLSASSVTDRRQLQRLLARVIEAFEPRLRHVQVHLDPASPDRLDGSIQAQLVIDEVAQPVSFRTLLQADSGSIEVAAEVPA